MDTDISTGPRKGVAPKKPVSPKTPVNPKAPVDPKKPEDEKKPDDNTPIEELPDSKVDPNNVVVVEPRVKPPVIEEPKKEPMDPKLKRAIFVFGIGIFTLAVGAFFLFKTVTKKPAEPDGKYLVSVGTWAREDEPTVIWTFEEGKGKLTTNRHYNDYDFIWSIEDKKLNIETSWLYTLNDSFDYVLNQKKNTLTLTKDGIDYVFVPASDVEETETN